MAARSRPIWRGPAPSRPAVRQMELPLWPLWVLFAGFPVLWVLGLSGFATMLVALPMSLYLLTVPDIRAPRGLGLWVLYLVWMIACVVEVSGSSHLIGFAFRACEFIAATVIFLYVFNCSPQRLPLRRLCAMATCFLAFVAFGGYLGIIAPHHSLSTPMEHLLPASFVSNDLVGKLVHPPFAQTSSSSYFHIAPRPAAPFPYTNDWGVNFAVLVPFVIALLATAPPRRVRLVLVAILAFGMVPALLTLNRGMVLGLGVGVGYAAFRFALRGHGRALLAVALVAGIAVGAASLLHFGSRLNNRLSQSQSTSSRESVYAATYDEVKHSPLLGNGAPSASTVNVNGPQLGTQGELWLALYSFGFPGVTLFVGSLAGFAWRTAKPDGAPEMWLHVVPVVALVTIAVYRMEATELALVMTASALALRDRRPRRPPPMHAARRPQFAGAMR
jgi:hypothetical protein